MAIGKIQFIKFLREASGFGISEVKNGYGLREAKGIADEIYPFDMGNPTPQISEASFVTGLQKYLKITEEEASEIYRLLLSGDGHLLDHFSEIARNRICPSHQRDLQYYVDMAYKSLIIAGRGSMDLCKVAEEALAQGRHMFETMENHYKSQKG